MKDKSGIPYCMTSKKRLHSFDVLKLFAIFLVLWGHCIQYFLTSPYTEEPVYRFIYSFHMPLFMMVAGFFATPTTKLPISLFLSKKFKQLILPCLSWGVLLWLIGGFINSIREESGFSLTKLLSALFYNYWFLKSLFICYLLVYSVYQLGKHKWIGFFLTLLISQIVSVFQINVFQINVMYPCFLVGICLKMKWNLFKQYSKYLFGLFAVSFIVMSFFWNETFWQPVNNVKSALLEGNWELVMLSAYRRSFRIIIGIIGSLTFIFLFHLLFDQKHLSKFLNICCKWGQYTLGIYVLQVTIVETVMSRYVMLDSLGFVVFNFIVAPLISIVVLIVCVEIIKIISRSNLLSFLFLGKNNL